MELKEGAWYKHNWRFISPEEFAALPEEEKQAGREKSHSSFCALYTHLEAADVTPAMMDANFEPSDAAEVTVEFEATHCIAKRVEYIGTGENPLPFPDADILLLKPTPSRCK